MNGVRVSTYKAFLEPLMDHASPQYRPNLKVLTEHSVVKIHIDKDTGLAAGVIIRDEKDNVDHFVSCTKEVVVSCGAVHSPLLLMRSGLGMKLLLHYILNN